MFYYFNSALLSLFFEFITAFFIRIYSKNPQIGAKSEYFVMCESTCSGHLTSGMIVLY